MSVHSVSSIDPIGVNFKDFLSEIDFSAIFEHIEYFQSLGSRISGYPGCDEASEYIYDYFKNVAGLENVSYEPFNVTVTFDYGANFTLIGHEDANIKIYPLEPNFASPVVASGLTGPLVYVGKGELPDLDGHQIKDAVVLMDYDSGSNWLKTVSFGAKAVIFIEPPSGAFTPPGDNKAKSTLNLLYHEAGSMLYYSSPPTFNFPRFYMSYADFKKIQAISSASQTRLYANITAKTAWETRETRNVMGFIKGDPYEDKIIVLSAHYDSYSPVLSIAPGANDAVGVATLLELARIMNLPQYKPRYTVLFIAFSGHHQVLEGARYFFIKHILGYPQGGELKDKILMQINIQISTLSGYVITTNYGDYCTNGEYVNRLVAYNDLDHYVTGRLLNIIEEQTGKKFNLYSSCDILKPDPERTRVPFNLKLNDMEIFQTNGLCGYGLETMDYGEYENSPIDTIDKINMENLKHNAAIAMLTSYGIVNTDDLSLSLFKPADLSWSVTGTVVEFNATTNWYDPVPNALVLVHSLYYGRWPQPRATLTGEDGRFVTLLNPEKQGDRTLPIYVFVVNSSTGNIEYARTLGTHQFGPGGNMYLDLSSVNVRSVSDPYDLGFVVVFKCATVFLEMPNVYGTLTSGDIQILRVDSRIEPQDYGYNTYSKYRTLYIPPEQPLMFTIKRAYDPYPLGVLSNTTEDNPEGWGYNLKAGEQLIIDKASLRIARDTQRMSSKYYAKLESSMDIGEIYEIRKHAEEFMEKAENLYNNLSYTKFYYYSIRSWIAARQAYWKLRSVYVDTINALPFFSFLLIPYVFLLERLLFSFQSGKKRLLALLLVSLIVFLIFSFMHPGFKLASNPVMVEMGFIMVILILPILFTVLNFVKKSLEKFRVDISGVHVVDITRVSAAASSSYICIQNMRKRKLRSSLTILTILLVTLGITLFSSLEAITAVRIQTIPSTPPYEGILIFRSYEWGGGRAMENVIGAYEFLRSAYEDKASIIPYIAVYTNDPTNTRLFINLTAHGRSYGVYALMGLPAEHKPFWADAALTNGTWLIPQTYSCILTEEAAHALNVSIYDKVTVMGHNLTVVGIMDPDALNSVNDLNGDPVTPQDKRMPWVITFVDAKEIAIISYELAKSYGSAYQISLIPKSSNLVNEIAEELFNIGEELYFLAGVKDKIIRYGEALTVQLFGWDQQLVSIAIAAFMVLNILLGGVKEREREILTYTSVGSSPFHVGSMFLTESVIYAVVGSVSGYLISIVSYNIFLMTGLQIPPLNCSSFNVAMSINIIILVSLLSSIYPAIKASRIITPSLERSWKIPSKPQGDTWEIPLPVVVQGDDDCAGIFRFLEEFLSRQVGEGGQFSAENLQLREGENVKEVELDARLPPYEYNVKQNVKLIFSRKDTLWNVTMLLKRINGEHEVWVRLVRKFSDIIRKQLLLWRTLSPEEKERYMEKKRKM